MSAPEYVETPRERALREVVKAARALVERASHSLLSREESEAFSERGYAVNRLDVPDREKAVAWNNIDAERKQLEALRLAERLRDPFNSPLDVLSRAVNELGELEQEGW